MKRYGFTLAEVLITLGIIGVVAAMTMPVLIGNYQKTQTVTQLKKLYSGLLQSMEFSKSQYGDIENWEWDLPTKEFFYKYFANNLKVLKYCENDNNIACWNDLGAMGMNGTMYTYNPILVRDWHTLILSDGTMLAIIKQDNTHIHFDVDLNGKKAPNTLGKDIFMFTATSRAFDDAYTIAEKPGLYMYGHGMTRTELKNKNEMSCSKIRTGGMCGALILMDGWQIKSDYPW